MVDASSTILRKINTCCYVLITAILNLKSECYRTKLYTRLVFRHALNRPLRVSDGVTLYLKLDALVKALLIYLKGTRILSIDHV